MNIKIDILKDNTTKPKERQRTSRAWKEEGRGDERKSRKRGSD